MEIAAPALPLSANSWRSKPSINAAGGRFDKLSPPAHRRTGFAGTDLPRAVSAGAAS